MVFPVKYLEAAGLSQVRSCVQREYLQVNAGTLAHFQEMVELLGHDVGVSALAVQHGLIDDDPQPSRITVTFEDLLSTCTKLNALLHLLVRELRVRSDDGFGVRRGLQQAGHDVGVEDDHIGRTRLEPQEQVEPRWDSGLQVFPPVASLASSFNEPHEVGQPLGNAIEAEHYFQDGLVRQSLRGL
ncbi:hypothetical protein ACZ91_60875 [Streptomyces regensis]|nr:hypothetical protein ACZ91_60875 [Streptomyces regensis]